MATSSLIFAGVPHTGKTTFLALLNLALTSESKTSLRLGNYTDDREYVNELARRLFTCEEPDRTEVGQSNGLNLSVALPDESETLLSIPDLSGETWLDLILDRSWSQELQDAVEAASGICVFIHAQDFRADPTLHEVERAAIALGETPASRAESANSGFADPRFHAGQVQLVDILQILGDQFAYSARRISLIISAFDSVSSQTPREWIEENAPLVHQYLENKADMSEVRLFGLSAQGGRFDDESSRVELRKMDPWARAYVVDGEGILVNLDVPVLWAINVD